MTSRFLVLDDVGGGTALVIRDLPTPLPGPEEIRIRVHAFGLNQADLLLMEGRHYVSSDLPIRLGYESCGVVEAVGARVRRFAVGDRVTTLPNVQGPYATAGQVALAHEAFTAPWPEGWDAAEASALWMAYLTAYFPMVELFPVQAGDWVLITAATGGAGLGAVAMAKAMGGRVIATSRSQRKRSFLRALGADEVIDTDDPGLAELLLRLTNGAGVNLVNDTVGGPFVGRYVEALAENGTVYVNGGLSGSDTVSFPILPLVRRRASVHGFSLINEVRSEAALGRAKCFVQGAVASGRLPRPVIDSRFAFSDAPAAYQRLRSGQQLGKIVVFTETV